jgi:hypothetical protein
MRALTLSLIAQILAANEPANLSLLQVILRQITLQAEFIYKSIEYTDIRGNHYAANLVALLFAGQILQKQYGPARQWLKYAVQRIPQEIEVQFCDDGVNFEKATGYHRLVTELFFLGLLALDKMRHPVPNSARSKLHLAFRYIFAYIRSDGLAPNFGDNDSASILSVDGKAADDHSSLLNLGAVYFGDEDLKLSDRGSTAAIALLLGEPGVKRWDTLKGRTLNNRPSRYFPVGGMLISTDSNNFFVADYGEVGQKGLGGHGHNDLFSFELCLSGLPLIVDSGCPVYTGNTEMYNQYRSTASHNVVMIDGEEMARLAGPWRIRNEARPLNVMCQMNSQWDAIEGEHWGYMRLADPVRCHRRFVFYKRQGRLLCFDLLQCSGFHTVTRFLYFQPGLVLQLEDGSALVFRKGVCVSSVKWSSASNHCARVQKTKVSRNYAQLEDAEKLVLSDEIFGGDTLRLEIEGR